MAIAYLVTGTTRGIGRALARQITANGDLLFSLSSAPHHMTASSRNVTCDLSDPKSLFGRCRSSLRRLVHVLLRQSLSGNDDLVHRG